MAFQSFSIEQKRAPQVPRESAFSILFPFLLLRDFNPRNRTVEFLMQNEERERDRAECCFEFQVGHCETVGEKKERGDHVNAMSP